MVVRLKRYCRAAKGGNPGRDSDRLPPKDSLARPMLALIFVCAVSALFPGLVRADSFNGFLDYTYTTFSTKTTDAAGQTTKTDSHSFLQRYSLLAEKTIFPKLVLDAGGIFERDLTNFKGNGTDIDSSNTRFRPFVTLTLKDPVYTAGLGYYLREETQKSSQTAKLTTVNEDYTVLLGWKPLGLPSVELRGIKTNTYDRDRTVFDATKDYVSLNSQYVYKGLDLRYFGTYTNTDDKLHSVEIEDVTHSARGTYSNTFLNGRLNVNTSYNIVNDTVTIKESGSGIGTVSIQTFPLAGLSGTSDTPTVVTLSANPALIDGNLTVSAGVNIGVPGLGTDTKPRNIGLDFQTPTEVNNLLVWVDRELPSDVASFFSWDIYTSTDNFSWTFVTTVFPAAFGPFQNRFDIDFPSVAARFIKVVVKPLQPTVIDANRFPDIFITELQAFVKRSSRQAREETFVTTTQVSNSSLRYRIMNVPGLYYESSYYFVKTGDSARDLSILSNGFFITHRLNRFLIGSARIAREDGTELDEKRTSYVYNASLLATPLRTLTSSLVFSGREEDVGGQTRNTRSVFLNNTAQLYRGFDVNLNGGVSSSEELDGAKLKTTLITLGANVVPHRTMTWGYFLSYTSTDRTARDGLDTSTVIKRGDVTVAYNPFRTLYLLASLQVLDQTGEGLKTLQNYGVNFSPFPDGALQFRFNYNETRRPQEQLTDRIIAPGVRYNFSKRSFLDMSYQFIKSESAAQTIDSRVFSVNLKLFL